VTLFDSIFSGVGGVADQLLLLLGTEAIITLPPVKKYNPATGIEHEIIGVVITVKSSPPDAYTIDEIDNTIILQDDLKVTVGAVELVDVEQDDMIRGEFSINNVTYRIVSIKPVVSGENTAAFELQLRG